jgi:hypothetical protein
MAAILATMPKQLVWYRPNLGRSIPDIMRMRFLEIFDLGQCSAKAGNGITGLAAADPKPA